jgi:TolB-like protein/DNA-binding winged helix-turn-helix (wHTH) protein/Tfp pilus assembly protein PilF
MAQPTTNPRVVQFGLFELDLDARELRKSGVRIKLQEQPFVILAMLVERPGTIVTREELQKKLWLGDTFVDFDLSLNSAVKKLRQALNDDSENPRFVETLYRRGYRFIFPIASTDSKGKVTAARVPTSAKSGGVASDSGGGLSENLTASRRTLKIASLVVVCVLAFLFILYVGGWRKRLSLRSANPHIQSLAVLPLANLSHDSEQDYFSDGMTDELITELSKIGTLRVISRTSAMHYRGTSKTLPEIARELNVEAIVEGSVVRSGNQVRITAKLIDAPSERQLWAESYERELKDVFALEGEVVRDIAQEIRVKISPREETRLTARRPVDPEAHEAYLKGRHYWYKFNAESEKSGHFFEDAIAKDPQYALAYVGLANYYTTVQAQASDALRLMPKAEAAAQKALALDSQLADAHTALAAIRLYFTWDWTTAERELKIALELNPNLAQTHNVYADYLQVMGQYEQAVAENIKAQRLDPLKPILNANLAFSLIAVKRYKEAIEAARKALEIDPNFAMGHSAIILANELQGNYGEAAAEWYDALLLDNKKALATLVQKTYQSSGYANMKRALARMQIEGANKARAKDWSPLDMADWYVQIGDNEHAFEFLEQAYHYRTWPLPIIPTLPGFLAGIRSDPRYEDLMRRIGVPR